MVLLDLGAFSGVRRCSMCALQGSDGPVQAWRDGV